MSDTSAWKIAIKHDKRPDLMPHPCADFVGPCDQVGFTVPPISRAANVAYEGLDISRAQVIRQDPFDRILIAQAKAEGWIFLTHDRSMSLYGELLVFVV